MTAAGERRFLASLIRQFGTTTLASIGQQRSTERQQPLSDGRRPDPQSSSLHAYLGGAEAGRHQGKIKRPIGWRGQKRPHFHQLSIVFLGTSKKAPASGWRSLSIGGSGRPTTWSNQS